MENLDFRPTRLEVDLDKLKSNFKNIRGIVKKDTLVSAVIKADAYGHGAVECAKAFLDAGCDRLCVSTLEEGIELRKNNINCEILLLNNVSIEHFKYLFKYNLTPSIYNLNSAVALNKLAEEKNEKIKIHIKIDTGMSRIGFQPTDESVDVIEEISKMNFLDIEGIFTHFSRADELDKTFTHEQFKRYTYVVDKLEQRNVNIPIKHVSNSAAILDFPEYNLDMVRAGIILYGYFPSEFVNKEIIDLKPAIELKTKITHIKTLEKNTGIGYGHRYITDEKTKIATVPIGYADGYTRLFRQKAKALINGKLFDIVGNICMDQCMINIKDEDVNIGDDVILISNKNKYTSVDYLADEIGTINYEILCMQSRRVPRVYLENKKVISVVDYLI